MYRVFDATTWWVTGEKITSALSERKDTEQSGRQSATKYGVFGDHRIGRAQIDQVPQPNAKTRALGKPIVQPMAETQQIAVWRLLY